MNDLQEKSLELLKIFLSICEKWNIPYFLVCGSALGAIKYSGFIPWDDDIDVGLLRDDYNRFLEIAPQELPDWCFLQNYKTEASFPHTFSKLRNSNTTFIEKGIAHLSINHGIYLDIFPIDGYPKKSIEKRLFSISQKVYQWMLYCTLGDSPKWKVRIRNTLFRMMGYHRRTQKTQKRLECLYSKYSPRNSEMWCNHGNWQGKLEYAPSWHYGTGIYATFEGLSVRVPENYDSYLTQKYGDWKSDPPVECQKTHHHCTIIDTKKPYTCYVKQGKKNERWTI